MPVDSLTVDGVRQDVPWLDPRKMVTYLSQEGLLGLLHGGADLNEFWRRWACVEPHHRVFSAAAAQQLRLSRTIPFLSHGDEGRTKKKKGILLWTMRGCVGEGSRMFRERADAELQRLSMGLNMNDSLTSRFLHIAIPKRVYETNSSKVWDSLSEHIAEAYLDLETNGVVCSGERWHLVCLGLTGDNPFLAKVGHLERNYARGPKRGGGASPVGVCWLCQAGCQGFPYEDVGKNPGWLSTCSVQDPWRSTPPFLRALGIQERGELMFRPDIWHNWHGGVAKHFVSCSMAMFIKAMPGPMGVDRKILLIDQAYTEWSKTSKERLHHGRITKDLFGLHEVVPVGSWTKFADSRVLLLFMEHLLRCCGLHTATTTTDRILEACAAANSCFSILYSSGFWLTPGAACLAGQYGLRCNCLYAILAKTALDQGWPLFPMIPKIHYVHHAWVELVSRSRSLQWVPSPLGFSVQLDEEPWQSLINPKPFFEGIRSPTCVFLVQV